MSITKLDSSGEARLSNSTLTFTVKVPETQHAIEIVGLIEEVSRERGTLIRKCIP